MKKRLLRAGLTLFLVLSIVIPGIALADGLDEFHAVGTVVGINEGDPLQLGNGGRWLVGERTITIDLGNPDNEDDRYDMTHHANVEPLKEGNFQGRMDFDGTTLNIVGHTVSAELYLEEPLDGFWPPEDPWPPMPPGDWQYPWPYPLIPMFELVFSGNWTAFGGAQGNGTFSGWAVFVPSLDLAHIVHVKDEMSHIELHGQLSP